MRKAAPTTSTTTSTTTRRGVGSGEDLARFGEDAERPVLLLKIPQTCLQHWQTLFENGGVEGPHGLDPRVLLATLTSADGKSTPSQIEDGMLLSLSNSADVYKISIKKTPGSAGAKMRVISSEVSPHAENVKFEGHVVQTGVLLPTNPDEAVRREIQAQILAEEQRAKVGRLTQQEEREAMKKHTFVWNAKQRDDAAGAAGAAEDEDEEEEEEVPAVAVKKGKRTSTDAAAQQQQQQQQLQQQPAAKKRKKEKKEKTEWTRDAVRAELLRLFDQKKHWGRKELRETTGIQFHKMSAILDELCDYYDGGGENNKTYSLKPKN